jgi:aconitase B
VCPSKANERASNNSKDNNNIIRDKRRRKIEKSFFGICVCDVGGFKRMKQERKKKKSMENFSVCHFLEHSSNSIWSEYGEKEREKIMKKT